MKIENYNGNKNRVGGRHHSKQVAQNPGWGERQRDQSAHYTLALCTSRLGAGRTRDGHVNLKHCYGRIFDGAGTQVHSLSFGLQGVTEEGGGSDGSGQCHTLPQVLNVTQVNALVSAFERRGAQAYQWGRNDCCSLLNHALREGLAISPPANTVRAEKAIKRSRDLSHS